MPIAVLDTSHKKTDKSVVTESGRPSCVLAKILTRT